MSNKSKAEEMVDAFIAKAGLTSEKFDKIMDANVEIFNDSDDVNTALENIVFNVRYNILGDNEKVSGYELTVAICSYIIGKISAESGIAKKAAGAYGMISMLKKSGAPSEMVIAAYEKLILAIAAPAMEDGHECTKCGKCGKKFDDNDEEK